MHLILVVAARAKHGITEFCREVGDRVDSGLVRQGALDDPVIPRPTTEGIIRV